MAGTLKNQHIKTFLKVTDMVAVLAVIAELAKTPISRDILERTRLGREINGIRRQNKHAELNKRAKALVREWRRVVAEEESSSSSTTVPVAVSATHSNGGNRSSGSNGHVVHSVSPSTATSASAVQEIITHGSKQLVSTVSFVPTTPSPSAALSSRPRTAPVSPAVTRYKGKKHVPTGGYSPSSSSSHTTRSVRGDRSATDSGTQHYASLSPANSRPATAPVSPAYGRHSQSPHRVVRVQHMAGGTLTSASISGARHSAPTSPSVVPGMGSTNDGYSQNGSSPSFWVNEAQHHHPTISVLSPSSRDPSNISNNFSRTNVANKRLRKGVVSSKDGHLCSKEEPPNKRQKLEHASSKPITNGGIVVDVEDSNSIGSSSGSGYCEVIDSVAMQPQSRSASQPQHSVILQASNALQARPVVRTPTSNTSTNLSNSSMPLGCDNKSSKNLKSTPRKRGRPSNKSIPPVCPASLPSASDSSTLPGASRIISAKNKSSSLVNSNVTSSTRDVTCIGVSTNCVKSSGVATPSSAIPSSSRAGRGRGRRRSIAHSPAPPDIKLPSTKSKVKTTSQLVAELAQRKGDTLLAERASKLEEQQQKSSSSHDDMTRNKIDRVYRYVRSLPSPISHAASIVAPTPTPSPPISVPASPEPSDLPTLVTSEPAITEPKREEEGIQPGQPMSVLDMLDVTGNESAQELLAMLPPIDYAAVMRAEEEEERQAEAMHGHTEDGSVGVPLISSEDDPTTATCKETIGLSSESAAAVSRLHTDELPAVNGSLSSHGQFRAWHEVVQSPSYLQQPLQLLPYVILDF